MRNRGILDVFGQSKHYIIQRPQQESRAESRLRDSNNWFTPELFAFVIGWIWSPGFLWFLCAGKNWTGFLVSLGWHWML